MMPGRISWLGRAVCAAVVGILGLNASVLQAVTVSLVPTDDVYITDDTLEHKATNFNYYPESAKLIARHSYIGPSDTHTLLKFDLSDIPDSATIISATLHVRAQALSDEEVRVYRMADDAWAEDSVTFASYEGSFGGKTYLDKKTITLLGYVDPAWYTWDMAMWSPAEDLSDNSLTLMMAANADSLNYFSPAQMNSKEYTDVEGSYHKPYLQVEYVPEPATLSLLALGGLALIRRRTKRV